MKGLKPPLTSTTNDTARVVTTITMVRRRNVTLEIGWAASDASDGEETTGAAVEVADCSTGSRTTTMFAFNVTVAVRWRLPPIAEMV